jgi:hypothetical protein
MKITFVGCSFTVGVGLENEKCNYTNLVGEHFSAGIKNSSKSGNSNYNIFMTALDEIINHTPDILFVQWSGLNRLWLHPGPDAELFLSHTISCDFNYRDIHYSKSDLQKFADTYHILNHDFHNILTLVDYCSILEHKATNVYFINGLIDWTPDLFDEKSINNPFKHFSDYTKSLLSFDTLQDQELQKDFNEIQSKLKLLNTDNWINLFQSMKNLGIDRALDNAHPGVKSHRVYADKIITFLKNKECQQNIT